MAPAALTAAFALASALLGAVSVKATPDHAVGKGEPVVLEIAVTPDPGAGAKVTVSTNVGGVGPAEALGGGRYRARLTPPSETFPQVALVAALVEAGPKRELGWLGVPVYGTSTLKLETKPRAKLELTIGPNRFGPVEATATGQAEVPVQVPPGVSTAMVRSIDRLGNVKVKPLDLEPPPFARARIAPLGAATASWADAALPIEAFTVDPTGRPRTPGGLLLSADVGTVANVQPGPPGAGVVQATYRAPERLTRPAATLKLSAKADKNVVTTLPVALRGGPAAKVALTVAPRRFTAGSGEVLVVKAEVADARGNALSDGGGLQLTFELPGATVEKVDPLTWRLRPPDTFGEREQLAITARAGEASGGATVGLRAAKAVKGELRFDQPRVRAGKETATGTLLLRDGFGNGVSGAGLELESAVGAVREVEDLGGGRYRVGFTATEEARPGRTTLEVRPRGGELVVAAPVDVLPAHGPWALVGGVTVGARGLLGTPAGIGPSVDLALRIARTPISLLAELGAAVYANGPVPANADPRVASGGSVGVQTLGGGAGLRVQLPIGPAWTVFVGGTAGLQQTFRQLLPTGSTRVSAANREQSSGLRVRGSAGAAYPVGPGQITGELGYLFAPVAGPLPGDGSGAYLALGYRLDLR